MCLWVIPVHLCAQTPEAPLSKRELRLQKKQLRKTKQLERNRYLIFEYGLLANQTQDTRMAQSTYSGPGALLQVGYRKLTPKGMHDADMGMGSFALLFPDHEESQILNTRVEGGYTYLKNMKPMGNTSWRLGGAFQALFNFRYNPDLVNSSVNWDFVTSLAVASEWEKNVKLLRRDMLLHYRLTIPVVALVNRFPRFAISGESAQYKMALPGKYTRITSEIGLTKQMSGRTQNRYRLTYLWDFYAYNESDIHQLRIASHSLIFSLFLPM